MNKIDEVSKMLVFDMDNTLLTNRYIDVCAEAFNFKQALMLLRRIDEDPERLTMRIASLLKGRKKTDLIGIAETIRLVEDIHEVIDELKKKSYTIGIISDSYQLITGYIANKIKADFWLANELQFIGDYATGKVLIPYYFYYSHESTCEHRVCKTNALRYICTKYDVAFKDCIVVGDGENDACMVKHAGIGVAFCSTNDLLANAAIKHITQRTFKELLVFAL
jgi:glucosyl-3-phosphoglycerate synthase